MTAGYGPHNKMRLVHNFLANPGTGVLIVRVGMRETGSNNEPGLPALSGLLAEAAEGTSRKRGRSQEAEESAGPKIDFGLAKRILDSLRSRCNMDEASPHEIWS